MKNAEQGVTAGIFYFGKFTVIYFSIFFFIVFLLWLQRAKSNLLILRLLTNNVDAELSFHDEFRAETKKVS